MKNNIVLNDIKFLLKNNNKEYTIETLKELKRLSQINLEKEKNLIELLSYYINLLEGNNENKM